MSEGRAKRRICFWQVMVTPHMAGLAAALAGRGHKVTYVAQEILSSERVALGWQPPQLDGVDLQMVHSVGSSARLVQKMPPDTVFITQGFRSNAFVGAAQREIHRQGRDHFVIMETVDRRGWSGALKAPLYLWHLWKWRGALDGVLAIGADTPRWLGRMAPRGMNIHPFGYFLPDAELPRGLEAPVSRPFRFIFVGALIPRKRVDFLIEALADLDAQDFELEIVGDGEAARHLRELAGNRLPGRTRFCGALPISAVSAQMAASDCLVLPSAHDGWGAAATEAMQVGTPVICSSACGVKGVVAASKAGGVFPVRDRDALTRLLEAALQGGPVDIDRRRELHAWARALGAAQGAAYVERILERNWKNLSDIAPPWDMPSEETQCALSM